MEVVVQSLSCVWLFATLLRLYGLHHAWLPSPSPSLGVCSNSCPLSWWCHPTISSSVFTWCLYLYGRHAHVLRRFSLVQLFAAPLTVACRVPLSKGFFRQEYWSEWPCPPPRDLPNPGTEPTSHTSPALAGRFFTTSAAWGAPEGAYNERKIGSGTSMDSALRTWKMGLIVK